MCRLLEKIDGKINESENSSVGGTELYCDNTTCKLMENRIDKKDIEAFKHN